VPTSAHIRVALHTWNETLAMVRDGRIRDAKSIAALLYYETFRRRLTLSSPS
jgi:hypothetical protein